MKVNLFYNYYKCNNEQRQKEIDYCFKQILNNPYIDKLFLYLQNEYTDIPQTNKDIKIILGDKNPTFAVAWNTIQKFSDEEDINIIINSDCFIEPEDIKLLSELKDSEAWTLTRYNITSIEPNLEYKLHFNDYSQDCWIFRKRYQIPLNDIDFNFGIQGCDNRFQYELDKAGYTIVNPARSFRTYHYHLTELRIVVEEKYRIQRPETYKAAPRIYLSERKEELLKLNKTFKSINKKMKHCHFTIIYNEIDFIRLKLPFLYMYFDQLIFFDLLSFGTKQKFSNDGTHEYIKNYPDPENKITLIEETNLDGIKPIGTSGIIKQKMFSLGSTYVNDEMDVFWCTDIDEFFKAELILEVENVFLETDNTSIQLPHYYYWYNTDYILTEDKELKWNFKDSAIRICRHKPGNIYGHCTIGRDYKPLYYMDDQVIYHLSWVGEKRIREKLGYYRSTATSYGVNDDYITRVWAKFTPEKYEKEKDENGLYGYPDMHQCRSWGVKGGLVKSPENIYKELPYLNKKIIEEITKYRNLVDNLENDFTNLYLKTHNHFGDHCICYGLVKELSKNYNKIFLLTINETFHLENVKRLYSTISNVKVITDNPEVYSKENFMVIGWEKFFKEVYAGKSLVFDKYFYDEAKVPFYLKWDNFYVERNLEVEKDIFYNKLHLKDNEYFIFLQEDVTRNFIINRRHIEKKDARIIETSQIPEISILDLLYTIEKSSEVHVINSSFLNFIDLTGIKKQGLFYHKYTRPKAFEQPALRLRWNIIDIK